MIREGGGAREREREREEEEEEEEVCVSQRKCPFQTLHLVGPHHMTTCDFTALYTNSADSTDSLSPGASTSEERMLWEWARTTTTAAMIMNPASNRRQPFTVWHRPAHGHTVRRVNANIQRVLRA
jgi:hypothetical protein